MNEKELENKIKSITDEFVGKENNKENKQQILDKIKEYFEPVVAKEINKKYNTVVDEEGAVIYKYDDCNEQWLKVEFETPLVTTCMSDEEFERISEAATDALTDMELKGYDIECRLRGVENKHTSLNISKGIE